MPSGNVIEGFARDKEGILKKDVNWRTAMRNCNEAIKNFVPLRILNKVSPVERVKEER